MTVLLLRTTIVYVVGLEIAAAFLNFPGFSVGLNRLSLLKHGRICPPMQIRSVAVPSKFPSCSMSIFPAFSDDRNISTLNDIREVVNGLVKSDLHTGSMNMMNILSTLSRLAAQGAIDSIDAVWEMVDSLGQRGCKPNSMAVSHFMQICVRLTSLSKATVADGMRILRWAKGSDIKLDTVLYTLQMDVIAKSAEIGEANIEQAFDLLKIMQEDKVLPNVITYTVLLNICASLVAKNKGDSADIQRVLSSMRGADVKANDKSVTALLAAYAAAAANGHAVLQYAHEALETLHRDRETQTAISPPLTAAYNALQDVNAKAAPFGSITWSDCLSLVELMKSRNVPRDVITYHTLMEAGRRLAGLGKTSIEDGWAVISAMEAEGVEPTVDCFHSLISFCAKAASVGNAGLQDARKVRESMSARGLPVTALTFATEMDVVVKLTSRREAGMKEGLMLLQEMKGAGITPDTSVFNALMEVCAKAAALGLAGPEDGVGILNWMGSFKARPDRITFNTMLDLCAKAARAGKARLRHGEDVLERMAQSGVSEDTYTLTSFIQLARADGSPEALRQAHRMFYAAPEAHRNHRAYAVIISALARDPARLGEARALLDEAAAHGLRPNRYMYNAAMHACETPAQVLELAARMEAGGVEGDELTDKLVERARQGWLPGRRPAAANDPLRRQRRGSFKDDLVSL